MLNSARQKTDKIALKAIFKPADAFFAIYFSAQRYKKKL